MNHARAYGIGAIAILTVLAFTATIAGCGSGSDGTAADADGGQGLRTVLVFDRISDVPSPSGAELHAGLEAGNFPGGAAVEATVLTDEDCAPDAQGVSHCRNEVILPGGSTVVLRHVHKMVEVPCLEPGERVILKRA